MKKSSYSPLKRIDNNLEISTRYHYKGPVSPNHWHDFFEFEIVLDGMYEHTPLGEKRIAKRGSAWVMSYLDYHSLDCLSDAILINISFTGEGIDRRITDIISSSAGGILCEFDEQTTEYILERCQKARQLLSEKPILWECSVTGYIEDILICAIRSSAENKPCGSLDMPKLLQSVTSYLHKNYKKKLSLASVAKEFDVSAGHLGLVFVKALGISYNDYINRIRLRHACDMLSGSDLPTKEIAGECGFNSAEYFFYVFKKSMGMTPKKYRENLSPSLFDMGIINTERKI